MSLTQWVDAACGAHHVREPECRDGAEKDGEIAVQGTQDAHDQGEVQVVFGLGLLYYRHRWARTRHGLLHNGRLQWRNNDTINKSGIVIYIGEAMMA